jgi:hypothetical protein
LIVKPNPTPTELFSNLATNPKVNKNTNRALVCGQYIACWLMGYILVNRILLLRSTAVNGSFFKEQYFSNVLIYS